MVGGSDIYAVEHTECATTGGRDGGTDGAFPLPLSPSPSVPLVPFPPSTLSLAERAPISSRSHHAFRTRLLVPDEVTAGDLTLVDRRVRERDRVDVLRS